MGVKFPGSGDLSRACNALDRQVKTYQHFSDITAAPDQHMLAIFRQEERERIWTTIPWHSEFAGSKFGHSGGLEAVF